MRYCSRPFALAAVCIPAFGAEPDESKEKFEGSLSERLDYMALRHQGPDGTFDPAGARAKAVTQRIDAIAGAHLPASYQHAEVWQAVGPAPLTGGQTPTSPIIPSPVSGRVSQIAIDPIDSVVFAGGAQGGVWRTDNLGQTWQPLTDNLGSLAVGSIVIVPGAHARNQATIYLGTGEGNFSGDSYAGVGIYKSTDSGRTWQGPIGYNEFHGRSVTGLAVDRTNPV